ncbi:restriction endonuclease [Kribbella antibiotica]|uniref:Restriction endonuclease n=1 Tax=Kribbella antibiotica TaxID=190195 RepID=A0A4R4ZKM5_9ACTN|nr:NaeI family type II restriction endonuclease [Kribbella antibiotica]TDD59341.1 restriction endonuclease [Kribbella antibiotica]
MSKSAKAWQLASDITQPIPPEVVPLVTWFEKQVDARDRFRWALRDSLDELLDGQRTGRWCYQHLTKTEKTYLGTAVEVNLTKEFEIENGTDLDWRIANVDVDCKFSKDLGGWEIPMEMYVCADHGERSGIADHPALLVWFNDDASEWAAGIVTISDERLRWKPAKGPQVRARAYNRDNKRKIDPDHAGGIHWLWGGLQTDLPRNHIRNLPDDARSRIFAFPKSGQKRVDQLFREVQGRIVGRQTVLTVAQQDDAPKRARDARLRLRDEGVIVLGHQKEHSMIASALGLTAPIKGEWIAVRVKRARTHLPDAFEADGAWWTLAKDSDPPEPAPDLSQDATSGKS